MVSGWSDDDRVGVTYVRNPSAESARTIRVHLVQDGLLPETTENARFQLACVFSSVDWSGKGHVVDRSKGERCVFDCARLQRVESSNNDDSRKEKEKRITSHVSASCAVEANAAYEIKLGLSEVLVFEYA